MNPVQALYVQHVNGRAGGLSWVVLPVSALEPEAPGGDSDERILLGVLDAVDRDPAITQRSIARELGVALGLTNAYLKRCVRKGLIKVSQVPARRYAYYLTPQGFAEKSRLTASYLTHSLSFFRQARAQCDEICAAAVAQGHRRVVLLGGGDLADIASLVAREHSLQIVAVVQWRGEVKMLAADITSIGPIDAAFVTTVVQSQSAFEAACSVVGTERVYVPRLLRLRNLAHQNGLAEGTR